MPSQPQFELGVFRRYRAITEFHVGSIESNLFQDEVIETDGSTLRRGGQEHSVPTIRSAIKVGWLVLEGEEGGQYRALPAGVEIKPAQTTSQDRNRGPGRKMAVVQDEQRDLGHLDDIRPAGAPPTHKAGKSKELARDPKAAGAKTTSGFNSELVTETAAGQEGRVISKLKNPAKAVAADLSRGEDQKARREISASTGQQVEHVGSGDVDEARAGDQLEELLPDAASSGTPDGGSAGEGGKETPEERAQRLAQAAQDAADRRAARMGQVVATEEKATVSASGHMEVPEATVSNPQVNVPKATFSPGMTPVGGAEDGEVVGSVNRDERAAAQAAAQAAAEEELSVEPDILFDAEPEEDQGEPPPAEEEGPSAKVIQQAKYEALKAVLPGFEWDIEDHWASRVKKAVELKGNMPFLNAILAIETETVKRHIMKRIYG